MIHASELRIGNLLLHKGNVRFVTHRVISDIASAPDHHDYEPIEINPDWFHKYGFEGVEQNSGSFDFFRLPRGKKGVANWVEYDSDGLLCFYHGGFIRGIPVKFAHQLQNIYFVATGEELTIKETV